MNNYEIELRKAGTIAHETHRYNIVDDSLEAAIEGAKEEIPIEFGSEYSYEFVSVRETARDVILPKTKSTRVIKDRVKGRKRHGRR